VKRIHKLNYDKDHLKNAVLLIHVGIIQYRLDNCDMALRCFTEAIRIRRLLLGERAIEVAEALVHVGRVCQRKGDHFDAISHFKDAIGIYDNTNDVVSKYGVKRLLGVSQIASGSYEDAFTSLEECLCFQESVDSSESTEWANVAYDLGMAKAKEGLIDDAVELLEKYVYLKKQKDNDSSSMSHALFQLGLIYSKTDVDRALTLFEDSLAIRRGLEDNEVDISDVLFQIGTIRKSKHQLLESIVCFEECLSLRQSVLRQDEETADIMFEMGEAYRLRQQYGLAVNFLSTALETYKMTVGDSHLSVANTLHCLGYVCGEYV
jgi:tetratricopeptide (TPR) repeat protein